MLTLMGDELTIPWRVLSIDFLVQDMETGGKWMKTHVSFLIIFLYNQTYLLFYF